MKKLSVIIVSYKNIEDIRECFSSVEKHNTCNDVEFILVDNSEDASVYKSVREEFPWVKAVLNEKNGGFGVGNNVGLDYSVGRYLLFLNPDTVIIEDIFEKAINYFEENEKIAYWGNKMLMSNGGVGASLFLLDHFGLFATFIEKFLNRFGIFIDGHSFISGACFYVRRDVFIEAGKFDEKIFMYHEESDLIRRIRMKCEVSKGRYNRNITIIHKEGKTVSNITQYKRILDRWFQSEKYYCDKYNLNICKRMTKQIRYESLKLYILKLFRKPNREFQKEVVNYYKKLKKEIS